MSLERRHQKPNHKDAAPPTVSTVESTETEALGEIDNERKHWTFISQIQESRHRQYLVKQIHGGPVRHGFNILSKVRIGRGFFFLFKVRGQLRAKQADKQACEATEARA